jgi:hypothetical protein
MWSKTDAPDGKLKGTALVIEDVLYEFDEPLIFRGQLGILDALFNKVTEADGKSIYLACQTTDHMLAALREGRLSVHGAFDSDNYWLVAVDDDGLAHEYWYRERSELPRRMLAEPGVSLYHWVGQVPDTLAQSDALFAIKFKGEQLHEEGIALGKLKTLVDQAFSTIRKLLTPPELLNTKSSTFDVEIAEPKLSSLVIAVKAPLINMTAVRRNKTLDKYSKEDFISAVQHRGEDLSEKLSLLHKATEQKRMSASFAEENFAWIDILSDILPDEDSFVSAIEFNVMSGQSVVTTTFDRDDAKLIRQNMEAAQRQSVTDRGTIDGIQGNSTTVRLKSLRGKMVTCKFSQEEFDAFVGDPSFKLYHPVVFTGPFTRRPRVDYMEVESYRFVRREDLGL